MKTIIKQAIALISLLFFNCSALKHSGDKSEFVQLSVIDIRENRSSYVLETLNISFDTAILVIPKSDFIKSNNVIVRDKTFRFEVVRIRYKVPHMEQLLEAQPPLIVFETDTIYKCKNINSCPDVYLFKALRN